MNIKIKALPKGAELELIENWLGCMRNPYTKVRFKRILSEFYGHVGKSVKDMNLLDAQSYVNTLSQLNINTRRQKITAVRSFVKFAHQTEYIERDFSKPITPGYPGYRIIERLLTFDEVQRLVRGCKHKRDQIIIQLLYVTGMRNSGVRGLRNRDCFPAECSGFLRVIEKGYARWVDLRPHPELWQDLMDQRESTEPDRYVFQSFQSNGPLDPASLHRAINRAAKKAGLGKPVSAHWLRHSHCDHALRNGAPAMVVQRTVGHKRLQTLGEYLHSNPPESSCAYIRVPS